MIRAAIFASGNGTNAENIMRFAAVHADKLTIAAVVCNNEGAGVIERAQKYGVPCEVVPVVREGFPSFKAAREAQQQVILDRLAPYEVEWAFLAGYMQVIGPALLGRFKGRIINIHPSMLPAFPGKDAYGDAWKAGVAESGITIHYVDEGIDSGPIILQRPFPRLPEDTFEDFHARGMALEYEMYHECLEMIIEGRLP